MEAARIQGSRIRLISKSEIRYEGTLSTIDPQANTVSLKTVRMYGTEGRAAEPQIPASDALYDFIIFRGSDIKDLTVYESDKRKGEQPFVDPAVVQAQPSRKPSDGRHDRHQSHLPASNYGPSRHRSEFNGHSLESRGMYDDWAHGQDKRRSSHPHGGAPQHQAPHTYGGYGTRSFERPAYPHPSAADRGGDRHHGKGSGGKGGGRFTQWEDNRHSNNNRRHSHNRSHHEEGRKGGKGGGGGAAAGGASGGHWNPFATHTGTNFKVQDDADAETARKSAGIEADFNFEEAKIDMDKLKEEIPEEEKPQDGYDKKKSFFDMLSCETSDKNKEANKERVPKNQREVMRTADISTFGAEAVRAIESSFVRERGHRGGRTARHQPGGGGYSGGKGGYGKGRQGGYGKGGYGKGDGGGYLGYRGGRGGAARGRR